MENFKPIQNETPKEIEKFADLFYIAVINLMEAKREDELSNGTFYCKLLRKLPERMVAQHNRWIFEHKKKENVEKFRSFIIQEAEFKITASKTVLGLHLQMESYKNKRCHSYFGAEEQEKENR